MFCAITHLDETLDKDSSPSVTHSKNLKATFSHLSFCQSGQKNKLKCLKRTAVVSAEYCVLTCNFLTAHISVYWFWLCWGEEGLLLDSLCWDWDCDWLLSTKSRGWPDCPHYTGLARRAYSRSCWTHHHLLTCSVHLFIECKSNFSLIWKYLSKCFIVEGSTVTNFSSYLWESKPG